MGRKSKRLRKIADSVDRSKTYSVNDAIELLQQCPPVKFDQSIEVSVRTGVDPRKSDQHIRGTVPLPNGTGKTMRILVITQGEKLDEAKNAGADYAGNQEFIDKIKGGWTDFDALVVTPDMMREVGKLGKVLGPRGLMPTPKAGTVTTDISKAVQELKAGKIEFKIDKHGVINNSVGKLSFNKEKIAENVSVYLQAILKAKPATAKGVYIRSIFLSSTMGPGIKIDLNAIEAA